MEKLREMAATDATIVEIAMKLERTPTSVLNKAIANHISIGSNKSRRTFRFLKQFVQCFGSSEQQA